MMLSTALTMMLDKAETVFLLNTQNVLSVKNTISHTQSPWIYHELSMTKLIRKKQLLEYRRTALREDYNKGVNASLDISYEVDVSHLYDLNYEDLKVWKDSYALHLLKAAFEGVYAEVKEVHPLDFLYKYKKLLREEQKSGM